jgi:alcohol dehydrogenase class IV
MFDAPHGAVCAALLPACMEVNLAALRARAAAHSALPRFQEIAALVTGRADATAEDGIAWIRDLCRDLAVPGLGRYGMTESDVPALVAKAQAASSMKANPIVLTADELTSIARASIA